MIVSQVGNAAYGLDMVTPIQTATSTADSPITVGNEPHRYRDHALAIQPLSWNRRQKQTN